MGEFWDIYDKNRKKTGKLAERDVYELKENEYHIVVTGLIINSNNKILISKRAPNRPEGLKWECNGGSILAGESSLEGILREIKEELGLEFSKKEAIFLKEIRKDKLPPDFKDIWVFKKDIKNEQIQLLDNETIEFKWVEIEEFIEMINKNQMSSTIDITKADYEKALKLKQREAYKYIGKKVNAKIDRPLNSKHPKHGFIYPVNYGYIPNTLSGDGEELDCYILGVDKPLQEFEGECIAVINRLNDNDDKLILVPEGINFTDEKIRKFTNFQEKYFESEIIR